MHLQPQQKRNAVLLALRAGVMRASETYASVTGNKAEIKRLMSGLVEAYQEVLHDVERIDCTVGRFIFNDTLNDSLLRICNGSVYELTRCKLHELASALKNSRHPFPFVILAMHPAMTYGRFNQTLDQLCEGEEHATS